MGEAWLALAIGNSHWHWAWFLGDELQQTWDTHGLSREQVNELGCDRFSLPPTHPLKRAFSALSFTMPPPLWLASVVPAQTDLWQNYTHLHLITLDRLPLKNTYPTLGIDRALALWGAIATMGAPVLVIDAGTALTLTGADTQHRLVGGAILPGVGLQLRSLSHDTATLPSLKLEQGLPLPPRWAMNTTDAIRSGVLYTLLAGVRDFVESWLAEFPGSAIALTGGDGALLYQCLGKTGAIAPSTPLHWDPALIFRGIQAVRRGD